MENISNELGTPIRYPSSWPFETSNITSFGAISYKKLAPHKYHGSKFEPKKLAIFLSLKTNCLIP
jgi:hypothetical protein